MQQKYINEKLSKYKQYQSAQNNNNYNEIYIYLYVHGLMRQHGVCLVNVLTTGGLRMSFSLNYYRLQTMLTPGIMKAVNI